VTDDLPLLGVAETVKQTHAGRLKAVPAAEAALARIAELDPGLNAFSLVRGREAVAEAARIDRTRKADRGPLHGVPIAIKEELDVEGCVTTFGGEANSTPAAADGEVVRRLRAAGAVVVGKTTMPEFGAWPYTESVSRGFTRNPWDPSRSPGGSSGGTAAAVASGMVPVGIGGDGGGSIRIPSACCGLFGLKPQLGRVSFAPVGDLWGGLGTIGPLTRRVADSALFYDVVRGSERGDRFPPPEPRMSFGEAAATEPGRLRIAVSTKPTVRFVGLDREQRAALESVAATLRDLGHEVGEADPDYPDTTAAFTPQFLGGVRTEAELVEHPERLERRTRETAMFGRLVPKPVFEWAIRRGHQQGEAVNRFFEDWDLLLTPTIAEQPRPVGALDGVGTIGAAIRSQPMIAYCAVWNVFGNPAASIPAGTSSKGLPLAVQLVGAPNDEPTILQASAQLGRELGWPERRPPVS